MFVGAVPRPAVEQITRVVPFSEWGKVFVGCSGSFRFDRAVKERHPSVEVHSNDVSLLTCSIGALATGSEFDIKFKGRLAFLEEVLAGQEFKARVAAVEVALEMAKYKAENPFARAHFKHYQDRIVEFLVPAMDHLDGFLSNLQIASFFPGDFKVQAQKAMELGGGVAAFPPTYKCLAQAERILTADLEWKPSGDLKTGDRIIAFDERPEPGRRIRRWQFGTVTRADPIMAECLRVILADGSDVICTPNHPWLVDHGRGDGRRWVLASNLMDRPTFAFRATDVWRQDSSFDAGWLSGIFDGEGTVNLSGGKNGSTVSLSVSQKAGLVSERIGRLLADRGFSGYHSVNHADITNYYVNGGLSGIMRALGTLRPVRLLEKFRRLSIERLGMRAWGDPRVLVVRVEPAGRREIQSISTSTRTYVGEGFAMHNSGYERLYKFIDENTEWASPNYDIWDPSKLEEWIDELDAAGLRYCVLTDHKLDRHEPVTVYHSQTNKPVYTFCDRARASVRRASHKIETFRYTPLNPDDMRADSRCEIIAATSGQMNFLKDVYLQKGIAHVSGIANFLVLIDGKLAGGFIYAKERYGRDGIYLLSDFALAPKSRVSKLVAMLATSRTLVERMEIKLGQRINCVKTTAFTKKPVSMKYRGIFDLADRKPGMLNYVSKIRTGTPGQLYVEWFERFVANARHPAKAPGDQAA